MERKIDLTPLSEETIEQLGLEDHHLWLIKLDSKIYGPFEFESLKHYVTENEQLFEHALASRQDEKEWKSFWEVTGIAHKKLRGVPAGYEGPFWIMDMGLKTGPFNLREIDKKIEMGLMVMTDHLSIDNGETWIKISQITSLEGHGHLPDQLPQAPDSDLEIIPDETKSSAVDEIANIAWLGTMEHEKEEKIKLEEMLHKAEIASHNSHPINWRIPIFASLFVGALTLTYHLIQNYKMPVLNLGNNISNPESQNDTKNRLFNQSHSHQKHSSPMTERGPSSNENLSFPERDFSSSPVAGNQPISRPEPQPRYETHVETHEDLAFDQPPEAPVTEDQVVESQGSEEHSLVEENYSDSNQTLDEAMSFADDGSQIGVKPPTRLPAASSSEQGVEEISDF